MRNRLLTISFREILKSYKRFISLAIMSFLGVAVFVGMRNSSNVMIASLDTYYDKTNLYDIRVMSTMGITTNDLEEFNKIGINSYGIHYKDVISNENNGNPVIRIIGINNNINRPLLDEGRLPEKENEIAVEKNYLRTEKKKIGDYVSIESEDTLKTNKFKIVGVVTSSLYILAPSASVNRGTTTIGNGNVSFYTYVVDKVFDVDYYTEMGIIIPNEYITSSKEYVDLIDSKLDTIEKLKSYRIKARYDEIYKEVEDEIKKNEEKGLSELNDAEEKLKEFKRELDNGYSKLMSSKKEIDSGKKALSETLNTLNSSKNELDENVKKLNDAKTELANNEKLINNELSSFNLTIEDITNIQKLLNGEHLEKENFKKIFNAPVYKEDIAELLDYIYDNNLLNVLVDFISSDTDEAKYNFINIIPLDMNNYQMVVAIMMNYSNFTSNLEEVFTAVKGIEQAKLELSRNEQILNEGMEKLNTGFDEYYKYEQKLKSGEREYNKGYNEYKKNLNLYNSSLEEYLKGKREFEQEISKARLELNKIEMPKWYIYSRSDDSEYAGYMNIGDSVINLSKTFPTIFFTVAVFMSIMCMSRMALEDRVEIGTLKSLGFSNKHIIIKYLLYSSLATIIGGILGALFGFLFLTWFVYNIYGIMYVLPYFTYYYDYYPSLIGILVSTTCITLTSILTVMKIVKEKPSDLLRPVAPTAGKKILLEYIPIWKYINFSNKVTIRNIFRYKKRVVMTIIGITGCTILLLTGYGIKDSITSIARRQFGEVFIFDDIIYTDGGNSLNIIKENKHIKDHFDVSMGTVKVKTTNANLFVVEDEINYNIVNLNDYDTHERLYLDNNKVVITDKLSKIYKLKTGDIIKFIDNNNKSYEIEINGIAENYVGSYIYMNKNTYNKLIGEYEPNVSYILLDDVKYEEEVVESLMKNDEILSVLSKESTIVNVDNMLKSLDKIVLILIILSGALSFVVLYNLSYINISERKREIATLKVLGFYYREVDNYIIKENFIITIIGIIIGLFMAKPFVNYIVDSIEIDLVKFIHFINIGSYIYTFVFMILFTIIVTIIIHFTLKKIDMIESLKTID